MGPRIVHDIQMFCSKNRGFLPLPRIFLFLYTKDKTSLAGVNVPINTLMRQRSPQNMDLLTCFPLYIKMGKFTKQLFITSGKTYWQTIIVSHQKTFLYCVQGEKFVFIPELLFCGYLWKQNRFGSIPTATLGKAGLSADKFITTAVFYLAFSLFNIY